MDYRTSKGLGKEAGLFSTISEIQDDRFRQIVREELSKTQPTNIKPVTKTKIASPFSLIFVTGFSDELQKISQMTMSSVAPKPTMSSTIRSSVPRNTMKMSVPKYTQVNQAPQPGPAQGIQPVLSPPPVRG